MSAPLSLPGLTQFLSRLEDYPRLLEAVDQGKQTIALSGLSAVHRAYLAAALHQSTGRPLTLVCPDDGEARRLAGDLSALTGAEVPVLPARDFLFHPGAASRQWEHQRLEILARLHRGDCPVLVATVEGLLQRTMPPAVFAASCRQLHVGQVCQPEGLTDFLVRAGYTRCDQVEGTGQFALRGGILDVFSPGLDLPVRMEFWGDEIDSMGLFDPVTQRRTAQRETCTLLPAGEVLLPQDDPWTGPPDLALGRVYDQLTTPADYLPGNALVGLCDTPRVAERAKNYLWQLGQDITALLEQGLLTGKPPVLAPAFEALCVGLAPRTLLYLDAFPTGAPPVPPAALLSFTARQLSGYGIRFASVTEDLLQYQKEDFAVVLLASSRRKADALQAMLREKRVFSAVDERLHDLPAPGRITIAVGGLSAGFDFPDGKFAVLAEGEALPARSPRTRRPKADPTTRQRLESFTDLAPGDLVVHEHHGIGRFVGMVKMPVDGADRDYIKLQFAGADILYVPALQLDLVSKYIGGGDDPGRKRLSKLGGTEWEKSKTKAKKAAKDMAKGLIQLYAQRQRLAGHAFAPDTPWQKDFEALFPYPGDGGSASLRGGDQGRYGEVHPHGPPSLRGRGVRQDRGGLPGHYEMRAGGQASRPAGAHHRAGPAALHDRSEAFLPFSRGDRDDLPVPHRRTDPGHPPPDSGGKRGPAHRHPQAPGQGHPVPRSGPAGGGRGAAVRGGPQGEAEKTSPARWMC